MPLAEMLARRPKGIILSGGPASVHVENAPAIDAALYDSGVPVLGICYGAQLVAQQLGGEVRETGSGEYGRTELTRSGRSSVLLEGLPVEQAVWMSHGDAIVERARRLRRHRVEPRRAGGRARAPRARRLRRAVPPRGGAHRARPGGAQAVPVRSVRLPSHVDEHVDHRAGRRRDPRPGRVGAAHLRALRRRRLRGRGRARPQGGRRPAHVRVRRQRLDAPGRSRAGGGDLPPAVRRRPGAREGGRSLPRRARRRHRARAEAQDHRRDVHPGVRRGRARSRR